MKPLVSLLTDFGISDPFVAEMKAVIVSICPGVVVVDISHHVERFNIRMGAFILASATPHFPVGSIHVAVVDPEVGSGRRPIAVETKRALYVGPDNGLLIPAAIREGIQHVYMLTNRSLMRDPISSTFHGRDIFAPVAAHLACGTHPKKVGEEIADYVQLHFVEPKFDRRGAICEVFHIDGFGNVVTNISQENLEKLDLSGKLVLRIHRRRFSVRFVKVYAELRPRDLGVLVGSHGFLEIARRESSAARKIGARIGDCLHFGAA
jgi:S-adenosylmethionine hydrolase